jgi:hypothetical protein
VTARSRPYPPPGYPARIPSSLWHAALATVHDYGTRANEGGRCGSEAIVYLGGVVAGDEMAVMSLYRLGHAPQGDRVVVTREESRWLIRELRARDEKLVGQLHSHRNLAGHSPGDDAWATSFHEGFLSIVVPFFGRDVTAPAECAILEHRAGEFVELDVDEVERRIQVYETIVERKGAVATEKKETGWRAFVRRLRSIARRRR